MRVFIGIGFDDKVKKYLANVQQNLKSNIQNGNFTSYNNFHLTLRFIGEVNQNEVEDICDVIDKVAKNFTPFSITLGNLNSFTKSNKHLLYINVIQNKDKLELLNNKIEKELQNKAFKVSKGNFKPHITLVREAILKDININEITSLNEEINISEITLFLSSRNEFNELIYSPIYNKKLINIL